MAEDRMTAALRGPAPAVPVGSAAQPQQPQADPTQQPPDGSAQSGYVTPDLGPFECENCINFQPPNQCNQPQVVSDPEVNGQVDPEGCCDFFTSAHNENQQDEHSESDTQES